MKKLVFAALCCFATATAFAAEKETQGEKAGAMKGEAHAAMKGQWQPRGVTHEKEVRKELDAFYKSMDDAMAKNDMAAGNAMIDFPTLMMTDNAQGQGMSVYVDQARYTQMMNDTMKDMSPGMTDAMKKAKVERKYDLLTDSLAFVVSTRTMKMEGGKNMSWKSGELLEKRDGKWMVKAMAEGGWGDMMGSMGTGGAGSMNKGGSMGGGMHDTGSMGGMHDNGSMGGMHHDTGSMGGMHHDTGSMGGGSTGGGSTGGSSTGGGSMGGSSTGGGSTGGGNR